MLAMYCLGVDGTAGESFAGAACLVIGAIVWENPENSCWGANFTWTKPGLPGAPTIVTCWSAPRATACNDACATPTEPFNAWRDVGSEAGVGGRSLIVITLVDELG